VDLDHVMRDLDRTVVVTVIAMPMVQPAVHYIVGMVAVRYGFVAAAGAVLVTLAVAGIEAGRAMRRVFRRHIQPVLVVVVPVRVVQVTVVQVIDVAVVPDGGVAARGSVPVPVLLRLLVCQVLRHASLLVPW
jgi:uncharacterized membrane protein